MAWIVSDADHLGDNPGIRNTRMAVALPLEWLAAAEMTMEEIVKEYPASPRMRLMEHWENWPILNCWRQAKMARHKTCEWMSDKEVNNGRH